MQKPDPLLTDGPENVTISAEQYLKLKISASTISTIHENSSISTISRVSFIFLKILSKKKMTSEVKIFACSANIFVLNVTAYTSLNGVGIIKNQDFLHRTGKGHETDHYRPKKCHICSTRDEKDKQGASIDYQRKTKSTVISSYHTMNYIHLILPLSY